MKLGPRRHGMAWCPTCSYVQALNSHARMCNVIFLGVLMNVQADEGGICSFSLPRSGFAMLLYQEASVALRIH